MIAWHLRFSLRWGLGLPLLALGLAGLTLALGPRSWPWRVLLAACVAWIAVLAPLSHPFVRYAAPPVPPLAASAAGFLARAAGLRPTRRRWLAVILVATAAAGPALARSLALDALFARPTTFECLSRWLAREAPAWKLPLAGTSPASDHIVGGPARAPWDPPNLLTGDGALLIVVRHPLDLIEDPRGALSLLQAGDADLVLDLPARRSDAVPWPVYDPADAFFYPLAGGERLSRAGPEIRVWRLHPLAPEQRPPPPPDPPEGLQVSPLRGGRLVSWRAPGDPPAAWELLWTDERGTLRVTVPPGVLSFPLPDAARAAGSGTLVVRELGPGGSGPPSAPLTLESKR